MILTMLLKKSHKFVLVGPCDLECIFFQQRVSVDGTL